MAIFTGTISKSNVSLNNDNLVDYHLPVGPKKIHLNSLIGKKITLNFSGNIFCENCQTKTEQSHHQGFCLNCSSKLAECDSCKIKPELCHYREGTCREPSWGEENCLTDHIVYLSYTSGYKVGITREKNIPSRWIDQGAGMAVPLFRVSERLISGLVEEAFKEFVADKTNWRQMLMNDSTPTKDDMKSKAAELISLAKEKVDGIALSFGADAISLLDEEPVKINYPIPTQRPFEKVGMPHNLDKKPTLSGIFHGAKGQYLYIDKFVINMRKYAGYHLDLEVD